MCVCNSMRARREPLEPIYWINILKGICALMVVVAHAAPPKFFRVVLIPVFLSGFFFVSGYTYRVKEKYVLREGIKTARIMLEITVFRLLLLEIIYSTIWSARWETWISVSLFDRIKDSIWNLWFFPCMFATKIIFHMIHKIPNGMCISVVTGLLSCIGGGIWLFALVGMPEETFWHLPIALLVQGLMQIGYLYREISDMDIVKQIESIVLPICMVVFILLLIYMPMDADLRTGYFTDATAYLVQTVAALPILVIGCRKARRNKFLEFAGIHSGLFYGYQAPFIYLSSALFAVFAEEMTDRYIYVFCQILIVVAFISATIGARDAVLCMCKAGIKRIEKKWRKK